MSERVSESSERVRVVSESSERVRVVSERVRVGWEGGSESRLLGWLVGKEGGMEGGREGASDSLPSNDPTPTNMHVCISTQLCYRTN